MSLSKLRTRNRLASRLCINEVKQLCERFIATEVICEKGQSTINNFQLPYISILRALRLADVYQMTRAKVSTVSNAFREGPRSVGDDADGDALAGLAEGSDHRE